MPGSRGLKMKGLSRKAPKPFKLAVTLLCWEGAFAFAFEAWIGPTYISALAGEVGVSIGLVSLLTAVPWIGSIGQLLGAWAYDHVPSVKRYTLGVALAARSLWILPLYFAVFWGFRSMSGAGEFPTRLWFNIVAAVACLSSLLATSSAMAWLSWIQELIPSYFQGRFFGTRQRYCMLGVIAANFLGSIWAGWKPRGVHLGYGVLGFLALTTAGLSTFLLAKVPDASPRPSQRAAIRWREPLQNLKFRKFMIFAALFNGSLQLAGPYFPYYMTKEIGVSIGSIAFWSMLTNLGCFLTARFWGKRIDRLGDPRSVLRIALYMIAASPLFYLMSQGSMRKWIYWIAPFDYLTNGMAWSAYVLSSTLLLLQSCPKDSGPIYFSMSSAGAGLAGALGVFLGGRLAVLLAPYGGFRALWVVASLCRFSVVWFCFKPLLGSYKGRRDGRFLSSIHLER